LIKKIITEELQHRHTFSTDVWLLQQSTHRDNITDVHNGDTPKLRLHDTKVNKATTINQQ